MAEFFSGATFYFFQVMLLVMLAVVGALVVWLHFQFRRFKQVNSSMPVLSDTLSQNLQDIQKVMMEVNGAVKNQLPQLESKLNEARLMMQEMEYVLSKSEKIMGARGARVETKTESAPDQKAVTGRGVLTEKQVLGVATSAEKLVEGILEKEGQEEPKARRVAPRYGAQAYGAAIKRTEENRSENEGDLRRVLEGRI